MKRSYYKYLVAAALILCNISVSFSNSIAVPMLTTIAKDIGVDISVAGMVSSITMVVTGFSLLFANLVQRVMKPKWIVSVAIVLCAAGNAVVGVTNHFLILLLCRAVVGVSLGMTSFATIALISQWLTGEERVYYLTTQTALTTLSSFLASRTAVPLMEMLSRSWHGVFSLMAMVNSITLAVWLCFGLKEASQQPIKEVAVVRKGKSAFLVMVRRSDVLILSAFLALISCAHVAVTTYLAAYLETVRGFPLAEAASFLGYISLAGMLGGPVASMVSAKIGRRKPVLFMGTAMGMALLIVILQLRSPGPLVAVVLLYGFFGSIYGPITQIITTEMRNTTPELASTAYSIVFAAGYLGTLFTSFIMTAVMKVTTMQVAMYVFVAVYLLACLSVLLVNETGAKAGR